MEILPRTIRQEKKIRARLIHQIENALTTILPCRFSSYRQRLYEIVERYQFEDRPFGRIQTLLEIAAEGKIDWEECQKRIWVNILYWRRDLSFDYFILRLEEELRQYKTPPEEALLDYYENPEEYYEEPEYERYIFDLAYREEYNCYGYPEDCFLKSWKALLKEYQKSIHRLADINYNN